MQERDRTVDFFWHIPVFRPEDPKLARAWDLVDEIAGVDRWARVPEKPYMPPPSRDPDAFEVAADACEEVGWHGGADVLRRHANALRLGVIPVPRPSPGNRTGDA